MKKIYVFFCLLLCSTGVWAQLLTENFSYTVGTAITANGWTAHSAGGTNAILVTTPSLSYGTHPGSGVGEAISMTTSGEDDNRGFTAITTGSAYASFMVNVSAAQATGDYFIGLFQSATVFPLRVYARSSGGGFNIGISKSNGAITYDATVLTFGTTYFIVVKYVYNGGVNDDEVSLWLNPALGGAETAATIANITGAVADATTIGAFYVRQGAAGNAPTQRVDAILVGTTWAQVTPTLAGTPNITVTPTSLTGFLALLGIPSAEQTYTVEGTDLTNDIIITPPVGFEIATVAGGPYTVNPGTITLTQTGGTVPTTTIYVIMNSGTLGPNTGNITHTSTGATQKDVALSGNALANEPASQGVISFGTITNSTIEVNFSAGAGPNQILVVRALLAVANHPADGTTYTPNTVFGSGSNLGANTYAIYTGVSGGIVTVTGLTVGTQYHFALYEYDDEFTPGAENYLITPLSTGNATTLSTAFSYVWIGGNNGLWTTATNWAPARLFPATNDSLLFTGGVLDTVINVPTQTIGYLGVSLNTQVNLQAGASGNTLTIGDLTGTDLFVEAGSQLNIGSANILNLNIITGATATINGNMRFTAGAHKLTAVDASAVTFTSGSTFRAGTAFTGNPFGTTSLLSVIFNSGSTMEQVTGSNPFGAAQPLSVVTFQPGSLYKVVGASFSPSFSGRTYANVEFAGSGTSSMTGGNAMSIDTLTITSGTVNINMTAAPGHSIKGNITIAAGATLNFTPATLGTLNLNGTVAQSITNSGTFGIGALQSLTINNAAGVTLNSNITFGPTTTLTLTSGILRLTPAATTVTISNGTTVTGASNASYIDGKVRKIGMTDFTFPVGKTGFGYVPIGISNFIGGAVTDDFTAEYMRGNARLLGPVTDPLVDHVSGCDYWTLDLNNGTPTVDITGFWSANNTCIGPYINNLATLALVHFDGTNWNSSSVGFNPPPNGNVTAGDITWPGVSTFSPFSLGSSALDNPLPITINYFTGIKQSNTHLLNWKLTCNSTPYVNIEMERSTDGRNFSGIYSIYATALRCQQPFNYTDAQPAPGINYYRIKMTDADGKVTYSSVVHLINAAKGVDILSIAPNPIVAGKFNLRVSAAQNSKMEIVITDMQGRLLQKQTVNLVAGYNAIPVNVNNLALGTYQVYGITDEGRSKVMRFVIQ